MEFRRSLVASFLFRFFADTAVQVLQAPARALAKLREQGVILPDAGDWGSRNVPGL